MLVEGATIAGDMSSKTDIRIDGVLEGNLKCEAKVVIGKNGKVLGNISCASILVEGKIDGNVEAKDKMHLLASSVILGGLSTNKLIIEDGAMFNNVAMMGKPMPIVNNKNLSFKMDIPLEEEEKSITEELNNSSNEENTEKPLSKNAPTNEKRNHRKQKK